MPGGDSNVILRLDCSKMGGKSGWGSVVSQRRKEGCMEAANDAMAFSRVGNHATTRCKFLRHTQSPACAAAFTRSKAACCCPPPMARSRYLPRPTDSNAKSCSSFEGSLPGVVMRRMGMAGEVAKSLKICANGSGGGASDATRSISAANCCMAVRRRSGLRALITTRRWQPVALTGNCCSHSPLLPNRFHFPSFSSSRACTSLGK
mmetsp:Transcript_80964/g.161420  ORF Transcript_80964/g.161420 Transcript_80964/m.161420 type:complete len:205 (-) Transcript_80964:963-1577(-)